MVKVWETLGEGGWNPRFVRHFNDWEMEVIQEFINTIQNKRILPIVKANLVWKRS